VRMISPSVYWMRQSSKSLARIIMNVIERSVDRKYGKLNHIINNAGFTYDRMLHTMPDDAWDVIMKVHVRAPFRLIRAAAPYMRLKVHLIFVVIGLLQVADTCIIGHINMGKPFDCECIVCIRFIRKRRPGQLCCRKIWNRRFYPDRSERMGCIRCACKRGCIWLDSHSVSSQNISFLLSSSRY
jgi:hypothetical protein